MSTTPVLHQPTVPEALSEEQWAGLERTANRLARVSWIPEVYRDKPDDIMAAGLALASIGRPLTPMTLKLVYVVNGTVDFMFELISAQVHAHGHEIWVVSESHESATVAGQRSGSNRVHEVTFTIEDAIKGGLLERYDKRQQKKVPTETYAKWTKDMLVARAGKRVAKRICPEATMTMPPPLNYVVTESGRIQVAQITHEHDTDDDIVDGELVDAETGEVPAQMSGGGQPGDSRGPSAPPPDPSPPEAGDNVSESAVKGSRSAPQHSERVPNEWRARAVEQGVKDVYLLRQARDFAAVRGIELPKSLDEITDEGVISDLEDWLG